MSSSFSPRLAHVGVSCFDIDRMIDFYTRVFNLKLTDKGPGKTFPFMLAFLSASPSQHHQLALAQNRPAGAPSTVIQLSFKVDTLDDLREARRRALDHGATHMRGLNHGNAISIYFVDPEENTVEVYLDTPWYVTQPHGDPLDLEKPDAEIWRETEAIVRADPTFKPVDEWSRSVFGWSSFHCDPVQGSQHLGPPLGLLAEVQMAGRFEAARCACTMCDWVRQVSELTHDVNFLRCWPIQ